MHPTLERLIQLESEAVYSAEPEPGCDEFAYLEGRIPVLLSAPHGAVHFRVDSDKEEDEYTSGLVRLIAEETGTHALYAYRKSTTDPNYYLNVPYKQKLRQVTESHPIHFVLDVHGCAATREFGIALGTMCNRSCPGHRPAIIRTFAAHGFSESNHGLMKLDVDGTFSAKGSEQIETITRFVYSQLGIPAAQIELNARVRIVRQLPGASSHEPVESDPESILRMIDALADLVETLKSGEPGGVERFQGYN